MNNVVLIVDINVDVFEDKTKLFNINNVYYVYCKHQCAIKVNVVYVVTYFSMIYDIEISISWHP